MVPNKTLSFCLFFVILADGMYAKAKTKKLKFFFAFETKQNQKN
jgi:hypothetical protein